MPLPAMPSTRLADVSHERMVRAADKMALTRVEMLKKMRPRM